MKPDIFLVKNLYNYEQVISPPTNLPKNMLTVYITDNDENINKAKYLGWNICTLTKKFLNETDSYKKRLAIGYINAFPHHFLDKQTDYNFIFVSDSNIKKLYVEYQDFVTTCNENFCLFVTSGYYSGFRNNILAEAESSIRHNPRWDYFHDGLEKRTWFYSDYFYHNNIDISKVSVCSAKYIGWNTEHPFYNLVSNDFYNEHLIHLQGNIILSYIKEKYKKYVYECNQQIYTDGQTVSHNYLG